MRPWSRIRAEAAVRHELTIEEAFPGVKCNRLECECNDDGDVMWGVSVSAPEQLLAEFRLIDSALLATLPKSGAARRGGLTINRGKSRTRVEAFWYYDLDEREDVEEPARNFEARILGAISPWRPKTPA